jgi:hypothetical protein
MKWCDEIGFREEVEEEPGVWVSQITSRTFYGDVLRNSWQNQQGNKINEDLSISNSISVVADPFLLNNFQKIAYVSLHGAKWRVSSVEVNYPRLTLTLGNLYLEEEEDDG